jgi:uncharacterized protein
VTKTKSAFSKIWDRMTGKGGAGDHSGNLGIKLRPDKSEQEIDELLNHSGLLRSACEVMSEDIVRAWRRRTDGNEAWINAEETFDYRSVVERALISAEAYGGCFVVPRFPARTVSEAVLGAPFRQPSGKSFLGFDVLSPSELRIPSGNDLIIDPVTRLPNYLTFKTEGKNAAQDVKIHSSWLFPVRGAMRFGRVRSGFATAMNCSKLLGQSRVDLIFDDFARLASGLENLEHILNKANIDVLKIQELANTLKNCASTDEMQRAIQNLLMTATFTIQGANTYQPMVIDAGETLERHSIGSGNQVQIVQEFMSVFTAVTRIPRTRLLGEQAKGLGNGGESDLTLYYDRCASMRERRATRLLNWMDGIVAKDQGLTAGAWEYNPLWQLSAKDKAEIEAKQADRDVKYAGLDIPFMTSRIARGLSENGTYAFSDAELVAIEETDGSIDLEDPIIDPVVDPVEPTAS